MTNKKLELCVGPEAERPQQVRFALTEMMGTVRLSAVHSGQPDRMQTLARFEIDHETGALACELMPLRVPLLCHAFNVVDGEPMPILIDSLKRMAVDIDAGNHDCLAKRLKGEPMFIILGRDPDAGNIVRMWAQRREAAGDPNHARDVFALADEMDAWPGLPLTAPSADDYPPMPDVQQRDEDEFEHDTLKLAARLLREQGNGDVADRLQEIDRNRTATTFDALPLGREVVDLVVAAREFLYDGAAVLPDLDTSEGLQATKTLDDALEKFASIVPWDDDEDAGPIPAQTVDLSGCASKEQAKARARHDLDEALRNRRESFVVPRFDLPTPFATLYGASLPADDALLKQCLAALQSARDTQSDIAEGHAIYPGADSGRSAGVREMVKGELATTDDLIGRLKARFEADEDGEASRVYNRRDISELPVPEQVEMMRKACNGDRRIATISVPPFEDRENDGAKPSVKFYDGETWIISMDAIGGAQEVMFNPSAPGVFDDDEIGGALEDDGFVTFDLGEHIPTVTGRLQDGEVTQSEANDGKTFEITTVDSLFDPDKPVSINGIAFTRANAPGEYRDACLPSPVLMAVLGLAGPSAFAVINETRPRTVGDRQGAVYSLTVEFTGQDSESDLDTFLGLIVEPHPVSIPGMWVDGVVLREVRRDKAVPAVDLDMTALKEG